MKHKPTKYLDPEPIKHSDWRDSYSVRQVDTSDTPGMNLIEVTVAGNTFQLYPNEFEYLLRLMNDHKRAWGTGSGL